MPIDERIFIFTLGDPCLKNKAHRNSKSSKERFLLAQATPFLEAMSHRQSVVNRTTSDHHAGDATDEKSQENSRNKFNELNFSRQSAGLSHRMCESGDQCATTVQGKNRAM